MNVGYFMFNIIKSVMDLGQKLYDIFTYEVDISFVTKTLRFFGSELDIPNTISLSYILGGASAVVLLVLIIYSVFKL